MSDNHNSHRSFAEISLAGEDERRRADQFARPARTKFWRHLVLFLVVNVLLAVANQIFFPEHRVFYYLTIIWAFILADNFLWAFVVDPDRDVHERKLLQEQRETRRKASEN